MNLERKCVAAPIFGDMLLDATLSDAHAGQGMFELEYRSECHF
jgi:hypothetical protein